VEDRGRFLLDRLLAESTTVGNHLLDESFDALLTDDERLLRDKLRDIRNLAAGADSAIAARVQKLLSEFGG